MNWLFAFLIITPFFISDAFAQQIIVNSTTPCFLNYTAGLEMWENCDAASDPISFAMMGFEWITGGYFTMILVSVIILAVYIKYQKVIYPVAIGVVMLPISFQFFPDEFWGFIIIVVVLGVTAAITWMIKEQVR